ncbi:MAG TPA: hypothetical protein VN281_12130 [Verrucomicrobiae bacterium]|jgi:hypothetical protein|nr:hypothetical protein [Verrucomicrobiae bacterium]
MQSKIKVLLAAVIVVCAIVAGILFVRANRFRTPVEVIFTITVFPADQADFVIGQARSAKIKYDAAKESGTKPALAQRLSVTTAPNSSILELKAGTETRDEARRFVESFLGLLKAKCEGKAEVALMSETIR